MSFWDIIYYYGYFIGIILMFVSMIISAYCKSSFKKFSQRMSSKGITADQVARYILDAYGVGNTVTIKPISGSLTDNFNPKDLTVNLSESVYGNSSIAAIGVAAHECGHAIQHHVGFVPNKIRAALVPAANIGSRFGVLLAMVGLILMGVVEYNGTDSTIGVTITYIGIFMFSFAVLFYLVTLPVEFDASRRALKILKQDQILVGEEMSGARTVLTAAAMTYVAAAASAILTLLRLISYMMRRRN